VPEQQIQVLFPVHFMENRGKAPGLSTHLIQLIQQMVAVSIQQFPEQPDLNNKQSGRYERISVRALILSEKYQGKRDGG